ncbi:OsmC family protein [Methanothrix harundinacea]|uniref:OsmC family protein n=1 Tax=Methanothrix harundinacea (strain 6Ac) TaxID=1110509 RepID=G7WK59_METH6|nr:OsmC family protein [Methanothrix harundinacea]AET64052.1 OsmC family protein [Methanothrix harundinacea 6Ac]
MTEELSFYNEVAWEGGAVGEVAFPSDHQIKVALPAEFGGVEGFPSPEDLFVAAANACVFTTTLAVAGRRNVRLRSYTSEAEGVLERLGDGREVTRIDIKVRVAADEDPSVLTEIFSEVADRVPVIRSMTSSVSIDFELVGP